MRIKGAAMKWRVKLWMFALATMTLLSVAAAAQNTGGVGGNHAGAGGAPAQNAPAPAPFTPSSAFKTPVEKRSYALGLDLGRQTAEAIARSGPCAQFAQGFKDALAGNPPLLSDEEVRATIGALQNEMRAKAGPGPEGTGGEDQAGG
jgi:hypothetical protein